MNILVVIICLFCGTQQKVLDSNRTVGTDVRTANGYKSAQATVCALKHRTTVCCPTYRTNVDFFPVIIVCILLKCYLLDFIECSFPFRSDISVNGLCTNGQQMDRDVRNIRQPCLCTNGQQTDVQNVRQPFVNKCSVDDLCTNIPVHK